jgi:ferrous iron transport protein B
MADADGFHIDGEALSRAFGGAPVVRTVGRTGDGVAELVATLTAAGHRSVIAGASGRPPLRIEYGDVLDRELARIEESVAALGLPARLSPRWVAITLLEGDPGTSAVVGAFVGGADVVAAAREAAGRVRTATGEDAALLIADSRFAWANAVAGHAVERELTPRSRTERLDDVLTSRWFGIPIFLVLMWVVFKLVTDVAAPFVDWIDGVIAGPVTSLAGAAMDAVGLSGTWFESMVLDGLIGGVGAVLVFVPVLVVLYLALGVLEDSGYMARAAFLMDRVMRPIGLNGKSFLPLLLGFGCNVPAVYATRVLERRRDRILTALLAPFVTCAARLPIYVLLAAVFFPSARGNVVFAMYVASIVVVLVVGALIDRVLLKGERTASFVLELPPYRKPSMTVLHNFVTLRVRAFLTKAGTVILGCSLVVWLLLSTPVGGGGRFADTELEDSAFAGLAHGIAPALAPAGLGSWEVSGTLVSGFVAKEVVVSTLEQVHGVADSGDEADGYRPLEDLVTSGEDLFGAVGDAALAIPGVVGIHLGGSDDATEADIAQPLRDGFDDASGGHASLAAIAFLAFVLLYVPCMATVAAIGHEIGWRWAAVSIGVNLAAAWLVSVGVFQIGRAVGLG